MGILVPQTVYSHAAYTPPSYLLIISEAAKQKGEFMLQIDFFLLTLTH